LTTTTLEILHISLASDGPAVVVRLEGDVDFGSGPRLAERLSEVVDAGSQVVVDLAGVGFVDPAGLAALLAASKAAARRGASFVLRAPQRAVARLLATTGADRLVTVEW
jgi:anti-anti-sigma factor